MSDLTPDNPMRVLVTGSRDFPERGMVPAMLDWARARQRVWRGMTVVHGVSGVVDMTADAWASMGLYGIQAERWPAARFGPWPAAGPKRNAHMVSLGADLCLAFVSPCTKADCKRPWPHGSHGATGCAGLAEKAGIKTIRVSTWVGGEQ